MATYIQVDINTGEVVSKITTSGVPLGFDNYTYIDIGDTQVELHLNNGYRYWYSFEYSRLELRADLAAIKEIQWNFVKGERDRVINLGFGYGGNLYDIDDSSLNKILSARLAGIDIYWTTKDNDSVYFTADEFAVFHTEVTKYINALHQKTQQLRKRIDASEDVDEIKQIVLEV